VKSPLLVALLAMSMAAPAVAQGNPTISAAKQAGQVGERFDGFLGVAAAAPTAVRREVDAVNIRRRAHYYNLAASKSVRPQDVGITAGCLTLASVNVGEAYLLADNVWRRRGPRQPVPVPTYCRP
jgi:uncharacterized protein YdbL (DUF1318 family)